MAEAAKGKSQAKPAEKAAASAPAPASEPTDKPAPADSTRPSREQLAAEKAFLAGNPGFASAAEFLGRVFDEAGRSKYGKALVQWVDPKVNEPEYRYARDSILAQVIQAGKEPVYGVEAKRAYYQKQIEIFARVVGEQAKEFAFATLLKQSNLVFQLLVSTRPLVKELHRTAAAVRTKVNAKDFVLPTMTAEQMREATGQTRTSEKPTGPTVEKRLRRLFYTYALSQGPSAAQLGRVGPAEKAAYQKLTELMIHPRGVEIVNAFARSSEDGWTFVSSLFSDTLKSIAELRQKLIDDPDMVWRFPPAVTGGVARAGLRGRTAAFRFALAWGASRKTKLEEGLEIAGNVLFVIDLFGGPLASAASDVAGFVLDVIGTAVSFIRDLDQDMAAESTAFAARADKLSQGSNKIGTVLQGLAAVTTGLTMPGSLRKLIPVRTKQVVNLPRTPELPRRRFDDTLESRGIANKQVSIGEVGGASRGTASNGKGNEITSARKMPLDAVPDAPKIAHAASKPKPKPVPPYTAAEREARYSAVKQLIEGKMRDRIQQKVKGKKRLTKVEAERVMAELRQSLPAKLPANLGELRAAVEGIMTGAVAQAKKQGFTNQQKNALGKRAHRYTEYLLDLMNLELSKSGSKMGVFAEQFRPREKPQKLLGDWAHTGRKKGSIGIDATLYQEGEFQFAIDLKTGEGWTEAQRQAYLKSFGLTDTELREFVVR